MTYPVHISKQKLEDKNKNKNKNLKDLMDLLLINDENKTHYFYIKDFNRFMFNKAKNKTLLQILFTMF